MSRPIGNSALGLPQRVIVMSRLHFAPVLGVAALLAACATSRPTEYHQGAFVPPPPAPVRPGVGAPVVGQPGQPSPVQPGPRPTRVLPETPETRREPGIWAGDPPRAPLSPVPLILGVPLPVPPDGDPTEAATPAHFCSNLLTRALDGMPHRRDELLQMKGEERVACFAARIYELCGRQLSRLGEKYGWHMLKISQASITQAKEFATRFRVEKCPPSVVQPWIANVMYEWLDNERMWNDLVQPP